jgi:GT2 family glycosyltransferase
MKGSNIIIVLILSYNGKELLYDSITSYLENDYDNFSVVVIDNGSTDGTMEFVNRNWPSVKVLRTDINLKYSGGFNLGIEYAFKEMDADYVLITNNDVKVDKHAISALFETANSDPKIGFTTGKVYYYDQPEIFQTVGKFENPIRWNGDHIGAGEKDFHIS